MIDGAQQFCVPPACGNGVLDPGEQCDDGNNVSGDTCSANCQSDRSCGNGILDSGEQCDDGNVRDHDGCSSTCLTESSSWVSIEATPPARSGAAFAYDSIRGRLVMFGGCSNLGGKPEWHSCDGTALDDTWEFDGTLWTQLAITDTHPGARYNHAMAFDASRGRVVLFGGGNPNEIGSTFFPSGFDDTWEWDGTTWSKLITPVQPKGRFGHAMAYDSVRHEIVLTGGFCPENGCDPSNNPTTALDTWLWDGTTWMPTAPLVMPPFRYGHAMAFDPHRNVMVLFGGNDDNLGPTLDGDTWEWDGSTWTEHTTPSAPSGRIHSAMVFDSHLGKVIMFGGCTVRQMAPAGLDWCATAAADLWSWDGTTWISLATQTQPTARFDHALAFDSGRNKLVIFGGNDTYSSRDDLWEWDGVDWRVRKQSVPAARVFVAAAYDSARGTSILFGGKDGQAPALYAETWEWDGNVWRNHSNPNGPSARMLHSMAYDTTRDRVVLFGGCNGSMANACSAIGDTWEWTTTGWTQVAPTTSPTARMGHTLAFDSIRNRVILFGGCTGTTAFGCTPNNETWEFDGATWTLLVPTVSPSARWLHGMAFDPLRGKVVMFGGLEANGQLDNDLWEWDGTTWTPAPATSLPAAAGAELAFDGSRIVMFGGCPHVLLTSFNLSCSDPQLAYTWTWDGSQLGFPVSMPSGRAWFAFTYDSARTEALMFGGNTESETWGWSGVWAVRGDTSEPVNGPAFFGYDARRGKGVLFDGSTWEWDGAWTKQRPSVEPTVAGPLAYDAARGEMVMFSSSQEVTETWIWDGSTWTQRTPSTLPSSRFAQALVYDAARDRVVMFGGDVADGVTDETWLWDGSDWSLATPSARPPGRFNHQLAYDAKRQRVVMFGGQDRPIAPGLTGTWEWDGSNWIEQSPVSSPAPRIGASMVYDFVRQRIVMFGGDGLDDMWEWDGTSWTLLSPIAPDRFGTATIYDAAREQIVMSGLRSQLINGAGIADTQLFRYTTAHASNACVTGFASCSTDNCDGYCDPLCGPLGTCDEARPRCGDGICSSIESCSLCPADCGGCSACGDLNCDSTETCMSCPGDCGVCP